MLLLRCVKYQYGRCFIECVQEPYPEKVVPKSTPMTIRSDAVAGAIMALCLVVGKWTKGVEGSSRDEGEGGCKEEEGEERRKRNQGKSARPVKVAN